MAYQPTEHEGSKRKKPKLEYIPLPTFKTRAEYKPKVVEPEDEESDGEDPPMSPVIEDEPVKPKKEEPVPEVEKTEISQESDSQNKENVAQSVEAVVVDTGPDENHKPVNGIVESKEKEKSSKSSSRSSGSGDRHKHKKSSSHKSSRSEKQSSSSQKNSSKYKSKEKEHQSSSSSQKSSEKDNKEHNDHHQKSSKHKSSSSSSKDRHHTSSSKSSRSSHSSSRKSKHKDKDKDRDKKSDEKKTENQIEAISVKKSPEIDISMMTDVEVSSDEDAVMEQCKAIFEEYQPELNGMHVETTPSNSTDQPPPEAESLAKKRVAYDGAITPLIKVPARNKNLNSMQQIYQRHETMRKMIEEKQATVTKNSTGQSSRSPSTTLPPIKPRPSITPVSNMLAFKYAKEKIEAMRQLKNPIVASTSATPNKPSTSTIAQTASKFYGRQAHVSKVDPDARPAPPVLEPTSTKISYNLRMQYYNMMVKHCLVIYPSCEDAWARAQTEELAVQKKCNTPNIYKSSALLAVNKLRKEAIAAGNVNTEK